MENTFNTFNEHLNESLKIDKAFATKELINFSNKQNGGETLDTPELIELAKRVSKHLGIKLSKNRIQDLVEYLNIVWNDELMFDKNIANDIVDDILNNRF
jgi:galactokinase/mevalonate kinase-like predicted kinase